MYIDLDGFKNVNDTLGHEGGDAVLEAIAARLRRCVRPRDVVARIGGDEFTILMHDLADVRGAEAVARRVLDVLSRPFVIGESTCHLTASLGVAFELDAESSELVGRADGAMYEAKRAGGNTLVVVPRSTG